jgi:multidrug resistance efflux pump
MTSRSSSIAIVFAILSSLAPAIACAQFGPATVVATQIIEKPVAARQTFVGTVMPLRRSVVGSAVDGRVVKFLHDDNNPETKVTFVEKGKPLANLLEGTIRILRDTAYAQLALRQAEYDEWSETHQDLIEQAKVRMLSAAAQQRFAQAKFERSKQLYESNRTVSRRPKRTASTIAWKNTRSTPPSTASSSPNTRKSARGLKKGISWPRSFSSIRRRFARSCPRRTSATFKPARKRRFVPKPSAHTKA